MKDIFDSEKLKEEEEMYNLGEYWNQIYKICNDGLKENPNNELLQNVMLVLGEYDNKYGLDGQIFGKIINSNDLKQEITSDSGKSYSSMDIKLNPKNFKVADKILSEVLTIEK